MFYNVFKVHICTFIDFIKYQAYQCIHAMTYSLLDKSLPLAEIIRPKISLHLNLAQKEESRCFFKQNQFFFALQFLFA